ncbi:MAG TPA: MASE1 domain-containing protein [Polyangiaceae bacterium]|nr:MASE1 domain-containing protein [Polyangiaceae bacterium]
MSSRVVRIVLVAASYAVIARLGLALDAIGGLAALVWPPTGLALAALLVFGVRDWPGVALGAIVANLWAGAPLAVAAGIAGGNTLEAVLGAVLLARGPFKRSLDDLASVVRLVVYAALVSTLVSATVGTVAMVLGHVITPNRAGQTWQAWWVGDVLGDLVVAPALLVFSTPGEKGGASRAELALLGALFALALVLVFGHHERAALAAFREPHVLMPLFIWASVRFGPRGAAAATLLASAGAIAGTTAGRGSFVRATLHESLLELQSFMAVVAITFLVLAAVTAERRRLLGRERAARAEAERAVRLREEFLAVVSHELRTPLTPLELGLEAMLRAVGPDDALRERVERAKRQSGRLVRLVEGLLDASRIAAGRLELTLEPFDCKALASEVVDQAREEAQRAGSALSLRAEGPTEGHWDRLRVGQALANLVTNAIKYGAGGPVVLSLAGDAERLTITCADQGIGIDPSVVVSIFERFERAAPFRNYGGLGLGLYVAREIARAHGGDISVVSTPGAGSTFTLLLPRHPRDAS